MATEQEYDKQIAPLLKDVAEKCDKLGMTMIARIEWQKGEAGITQIGRDKMGMEQLLTTYAAHARGNFDLLTMTLKKNCDTPGTSMVMRMVYPND